MKSEGLRQKLKLAGAVDWIENVYGIGYRLQPQIISKSTEDSKTKELPESLALGISNPPSSIEQQFNQATEELWEQYRGLMTQRLAVLQAAATAIEKKDLFEKLRQEARQAAHKLAGGLRSGGVRSAIAQTIQSVPAPGSQSACACRRSCDRCTRRKSPICGN